MWILTTALLALALGLALWRLTQDRAARRQLLEAVSAGRPLLTETGRPQAASEWNHLSAGLNELLEELQQLRQQRTGQLSQLEATLGSLQEAVLVVDAGNRIVLANRALHAIFPRSSPALHQRVEQVLPGTTFLAYLEDVRAGRAEPREQIEVQHDSGARWVEITGTTLAPTPAETAPLVLFVLHDVTQHKRLERMRKEFVANVSHELRTPLSVIRGNLETLVDEQLTMSETDRDRFLRTAQRHTERLTSLLNDLLLLSRLESGNPELRAERADLGELLRTVFNDYSARPTATQHRLTLEVPDRLPQLRLDPLRITQVFENLLDNALKYTPAGSFIHISATRQGGEVHATVRDNGPGIPEQDLGRVFERFYRIDKGRSRDKGGTGLGLSIVKHIVQLHGGRVWAQSRVGEGTTFGVALPVPPLER